MLLGGDINPDIEKHLLLQHIKVHYTTHTGTASNHRLSVRSTAPGNKTAGRIRHLAHLQPSANSNWAMSNPGESQTSPSGTRAGTQLQPVLMFQDQDHGQ